MDDALDLDDFEIEMGDGGDGDEDEGVIVGDGGTVDDLLPPVGLTAGGVAGASLPGFFDPDRGNLDDDGRDGREPRTYPVALFDGREVTGPFHRPASDGSPMVEVCPIVKNAKGELTRGACELRVPYDWDEEQLAAEVDPGTWYLVVRGLGGRILAGTSLRIGRTASHGRSPERMRRRPGGAPTTAPNSKSQLAGLLGAIVKGQQQQGELLERLMREKMEREAEDAREARERDRQVFAETITRLEGFAKRAGKPEKVTSLAEALRAHLEDRRRADELLAELGAARGDTAAEVEEEDVMTAAAGRVEGWIRMAKAFVGDEDADD